MLNVWIALPERDRHRLQGGARAGGIVLRVASGRLDEEVEQDRIAGREAATSM